MSDYQHVFGEARCSVDEEAFRVAHEQEQRLTFKLLAAIPAGLPIAEKVATDQ